MLIECFNTKLLIIILQEGSLIFLESMITEWDWQLAKTILSVSNNTFLGIFGLCNNITNPTIVERALYHCATQRLIERWSLAPQTKAQWELLQSHLV